MLICAIHEGFKGLEEEIQWWWESNSWFREGRIRSVQNTNVCGDWWITINKGITRKCGYG